jgi:hypothetical protein
VQGAELLGGLEGCVVPAADEHGGGGRSVASVDVAGDQQRDVGSGQAARPAWGAGRSLTVLHRQEAAG